MKGKKEEFYIMAYVFDPIGSEMVGKKSVCRGAGVCPSGMWFTNPTGKVQARP